MRKILILTILFLVSALLFAQEQAVLREFSGKVEVMPPGKNWEPAARNLVLPQGTVISTGFNSFATIQAGSSMIQVKPLTRMAVAELVKAQGEQKTTLDLKVGRVRAKVEKVEGLEHDFTLKSPVSTAAVRGTDFEYSGNQLQVFDGVVRYLNAISQGRTITRGEQSSIQGLSAPAAPEEAAVATAKTEVSTKPAGAPEGAGGKVSLTGTLKVTVK
ncbi:MAG: FecR family protein [Spirochaetes bacterium]|nr:FecR family protein [Spirochaetota bacterium]